MLPLCPETKIYLASQPVDFRLSMSGLANIIQREITNKLHDGSVYVFYNKHQNKIKCLFWDNNGLVLYYKRFDTLQFRITGSNKGIKNITATELKRLLDAAEPEIKENKKRALKAV